MNKQDQKRENILKHNLFLAFFFTVPFNGNLYHQLHKIEATCHHNAEKECNGEPVSKTWEERATKRIRETIGGNSPNLDRIFLNGDPRGYALKIEMSNEEFKKYWEDGRMCHRDWGGNFLLAPEF